LRSLAGMGLIYDVAADPDFESLRDLPAFHDAATKIAASKNAVTHSTLQFAIPDRDLIPEDIAYDPSTRRFFLSSVRRGVILTADGKEFARAEWSVMGLRADPKRRLLWATTAWLPHCDECKPEDKDKTALLAFDLDSGALKQRIESPVAGAMGDLTLSSNGDVFVSEGLHGAVFWLKPGSKTFERLDSPGEFPSPQTPALSADERTLYVPDYARGIAAIRLADRHVEWMHPADGVALNGIDGLYRYGSSFWPSRTARIRSAWSATRWISVNRKCWRRIRPGSASPPTASLWMTRSTSSRTAVGASTTSRARRTPAHPRWNPRCDAFL
jgi:hypothetical protein